MSQDPIMIRISAIIILDICFMHSESLWMILLSSYCNVIVFDESHHLLSVLHFKCNKYPSSTFLLYFSCDIIYEILYSEAKLLYMQFKRLLMQISLFICDCNKSENKSDVGNLNLSFDHAVAGKELIPEMLVIKCTCTCPPSSFSDNSSLYCLPSLPCFIVKCCQSGRLQLSSINR